MVEIRAKARQKKSPARDGRGEATPCPLPDRGEGPDLARAMESIVGCKWAVAILDQLRRGVNRPGALGRAIPGLSTKVMNERLNRMLRFGLIRREAFPEAPPRVEYRLTPIGERFAAILDQLRSLQAELDAGEGDAGHEGGEA